MIAVVVVAAAAVVVAAVAAAVRVYRVPCASRGLRAFKSCASFSLSSLGSSAAVAPIR